MDSFVWLTDIEWELIFVNSQLVIKNIQEVENAKRVERRERELRELSEFQVMEFKMSLEEKEALLVENAREDAERLRERMELAEFEILEKQFENEEKLAALEKVLQEERSCRKKYIPLAQQQQQQTSLERNVTTSSPIQDQRCRTVLISILSNKQINNNNNNNTVIKKVRFIGLNTASVHPVRAVDDVAKVVNTRNASPRKCKLSLSRIPKLFNTRRRSHQWMVNSSTCATSWLLHR